MKKDLNARIDRAQGALAAITARAVLTLALRRGVCPKCGAHLVREESGLVCSASECSGIEDARRAVHCAEVLANR